MATGFTAGTPLGSQFQYTPITFAPLLSLVPQRPAAAPEAPAPTGLEATAQMPVPQYIGGQEGPGMEMPQGMPSGAMGNPQLGITDLQGVPMTLGDVLGQIANLGSLMMSPLSFGVQAMMGNLPGTAVKGMMTPVETINPAAIALAEQLGVSVNTAQGLVDLGYGSPGSTAEESTVGMDVFGPSGPSADIGDVGGIGGIGDVSEGSGGASPW